MRPYLHYTWAYGCLIQPPYMCPIVLGASTRGVRLHMQGADTMAALNSASLNTDPHKGGLPTNVNTIKIALSRQTADLHAGRPFKIKDVLLILDKIMQSFDR